MMALVPILAYGFVCAFFVIWSSWPVQKDK